jgi:hypothetical protein
MRRSGGNRSWATLRSEPRTKRKARAKE